VTEKDVTNLARLADALVPRRSAERYGRLIAGPELDQTVRSSCTDSRADYRHVRRTTKHRQRP